MMNTTMSPRPDMKAKRQDKYHNKCKAQYKDKKTTMNA
jgi:hypothetical protein